jgi:hypothetical protein
MYSRESIYRMKYEEGKKRSGVFVTRIMETEKNQERSDGSCSFCLGEEDIKRSVQLSTRE